MHPTQTIAIGVHNHDLSINCEPRNLNGHESWLISCSRVEIITNKISLRHVLALSFRTYLYSAQVFQDIKSASQHGSGNKTSTKILEWLFLPTWWLMNLCVSEEDMSALGSIEGHLKRFWWEREREPKLFAKLRENE